MIHDFITCLLILLGSLFMFLAALGIVRMPDLYTRMHAATKVGTIGVICVLGGVILVFQQLDVTTKGLLIILFFLLTAPVASHMIGRAAFLTGIPFWEKTRINEWEEERKQHPEREDNGEGSSTLSR